MEKDNASLSRWYLIIPCLVSENGENYILEPEPEFFKLLEETDDKGVIDCEVEITYSESEEGR